MAIITSSTPWRSGVCEKAQLARSRTGSATKGAATDSSKPLIAAHTTHNSAMETELETQTDSTDSAVVLCTWKTTQKTKEKSEFCAEGGRKYSNNVNQTACPRHKARSTRLQQQNIQSIMAFTRLCNRICNILFWGLLASLKFVNSLFATAPDPTYYFQINIELPLFTSRHKSQQFPLSVLDQLRERRSPRTLWIHFGFAICNLCTRLGLQTSCRLIYNSEYLNRMATLLSLAYDKSL